MPRTNQDGKDLRLVISWLRGRFTSDAEMADALGIPPTNYSRRKDLDEFPTFEDLGRVAAHFNLSALALQVAFGHLDAGVVVMDEAGLKQYIEQGGQDLSLTVAPNGDAARRRRRADAPPGP